MPNHNPQLKAFVIWACIFGGWGACRLADDYLFFKSAIRSFGTVISADSKQNRSSVSWDLEIQFDLLGNKKVCVSHLHTQDGLYEKGQNIRIFYNPANPADIRLDEPWDRWATSIGLLLAGRLPFIWMGLHRLHVLSRKEG